MENVRSRPIRESRHVPGQARRLPTDELESLAAGYSEGRWSGSSRGVAAEHL